MPSGATKQRELDRKVSHRTQAIQRLESEMKDSLEDKKLAECVKMLSVEEREELARQFKLFDEDNIQLFYIKKFPLFKGKI